MAMLNDKQKIKLIEECIGSYKKIGVNIDVVYKLFGSADSEFIDEIWTMFDLYIKNTEMLLEDEFNFLSWYIFDNECGERELTCKIKNGAEFKIKTIKQLLNAIKKSK
jgi:hypothetical protein